MIKSVLTIIIVLSLVFVLGCSEISDLIQDLARVSSSTSPDILRKAEFVSKWQMNQTSSEVGAYDESLILSELASGDKIDGSSYIAYYIDDTHLTSGYVNPIDIGASANETFTWTARGGSHAIKAVADETNHITENDEANNEKTLIFLSLPPDLIIETITWSPENPAIGNTVTFTVTIKNQGSGPSGSCYVAYYIDDTYLTSDHVNPIDAGASADESFTWTAQAGSHVIKAVADSNNEVTESDEANNIKIYSLSTLAPDLIIETITWEPENPQINDMVTFTVTIKNQGSARARPSRVYFYIDGSSRGYQEVQGIDAGATATETFTWFAKAGSHAIKAVADETNYITENDETNNEKTITFLTFPPDLIIEMITWEPADSQEEGAVGETVIFTVTIKNQGGKSDFFYVAYYIDDAYRTSAIVNPIDAGASANKTFTWTAKFGSPAIKAVADSKGQVTESDETNNEKTITFLTIAPDLIVETITWEPENPQRSDNVTFSVTIKNQGNSSANPSRVYLYIDGSSRGYMDIKKLVANAAKTETFIWPAQTGSHAIKAVADETNHITENDEANNEKTVIFLTLPPDLIIEMITASPVGPSLGETVTYTATIKNQGSGPSGPSYVAYYIDDTYLTSDYVNPLNAGASANETFIWSAQADYHTIKAVADSNNEVTESDETNNENTVISSVRDLIIETITGSPTGPSVGDTVTFTVTIKNQGNVRAGPSRVAYYIDGSSRGYQQVQEIDAGATATKTFTWIAQAGYHTIKAVADSKNEVTESDETNNENTVIFPVPDLIIETITWSPEEPSESDTVTFSVIIKNQGSDITGSSRVAYYIDDAYLTSALVNPIDAGASANETFSWIAQGGSYAIKAVADSNNEVTESDEANNENTVILSVFLPPAPTPTPAPTPSTEPQVAPGGTTTPIPPPEKGIWPGLWMVLGIIVVGGTIVMILLGARQQLH
jgi:subtilase family serine protease